MICKKSIALILASIFLQGCIVQLTNRSQTNKKSTFEEVDFQGLMKRYMQKSESNSIEGVYSVSGSVTKKGKGFLGIGMKEKVTDRKENYAKIAILHDGENGRDYIELALDKQGLSSYSIIGEFNAITNGNILIYKHYDRKGKNNAAFTFTHDESHEILEGIRVDNEGNSQITYKLTYVKLSPK